jgi:hypothetical protein
VEATQSEHLHFAWKGEAEGKPEVDVKLRMESTEKMEVGVMVTMDGDLKT